MGTIFFFDDWKLLERQNSVRCTGQPKWDQNAVLVDRRTEGAWNYPTVFREADGTWTALYGGTQEHSFDEISGFHIKSVELLIAQSADGRHWKTVPQYHAWESEAENCVFNKNTGHVNTRSAQCRIDCGPVFHDLWDVNSSRRFKLLFRDFDENGKATERLAVSGDGKTWRIEKQLTSLPYLMHSPTPCYYCQQSGKYVVVNRFSLHDRRIAFYETPDFVQFQPPVLVLQADSEDVMLAETYAMPVFLYENIYIGFLWMFHPHRNDVRTNRLIGTVDSCLCYSYDGRSFQRCGHQPFIKLNEPGEFAGGCIFPCSLIEDGDSLRIYSSGAKGEMFAFQEEDDAALLLHTLRKDGFAYLQTTGYGWIRTRCLRFYGNDLRINVNASYGCVRGRLLAEGGQPVPGFDYEQSLKICRDDIDAVLSWECGSFQTLYGHSVFLELELYNCRVYAIRGDFDVYSAGDNKLP